jgi:ribonuclease HI
MIELSTLIQSTLIINTDGGSRGNPGHAALGFIIHVDGQILFEEGKYLGLKTNNEAEYAAFFASLEWVVQNLQPGQVKQVVWQLDSLLVVEQLNKKWKIKEPRMREFAQQIWQMLSTASFTYQIKHIPRAENALADAIVNQTLDSQLS